MCPAGSTRSRTRRAASARRRPRSTSPPASRRPASGRSSSISTRRRTRPRASASARTAPRRSTCSTASRCRELAKPTRFAEPRPRARRKPELAGAAVELARRDDGERYLADALAGAREDYAFVFVDCPPSLGPLTVNALAAADRVLVPVQAEYYALEGLAQLVGSVELIRARLNPKLALGGVILTMVDGRTRLAADVAAEVRRHFGELVFTHVRAALGARGRGAEPRPARDRLRPRARPAPTRTGRWRWSLSSRS